MTCKNGHGLEYEFIAGRNRCRECYRAACRASAQRRRDRLRAGIPAPTAYTHTCPECGRFPCLCEAL